MNNTDIISNEKNIDIMDIKDKKAEMKKKLWFNGNLIKGIFKS